MFTIFLIVGLAMCFVGNTFLGPVLFLTGVAQASFIIMIICYSTFAKQSEEIWIGWVILLVSAFVGILVGFLFIKF